MGLRLKFNLCFISILLLALVGFGFTNYRQLDQMARSQVKEEASLLMEVTLAARTYTSTQIKPHLESRLDVEFLPQIIPAYAATEIFNDVRKRFPAYGYKEATLNPTNLRDKATEWEAEIVNAFRQQSDKAVIEGQRMEGGRSFLYLARPIKAGAACLLCHSTPETAPASMLRLYGDKHGFGWKTNEIIGAQIVTVPEEVPVARAQEAFQTFLLTLVTVFAVLGVALHFLMGRLVLDPIERMVESADAISKGKLDVPELAEASTDEVGRLAMAFNRMIRSLKRAMNLLEK